MIARFTLLPARRIQVDSAARRVEDGFTIVELLVVVTLIVILLALLTPALDKAVYAAELTVCGANISAAARAGIGYAMDRKRQYPTRGAYEFEANQLVNNSAPEHTPEKFDLRNSLLPYVGVNAWVDPLCGEIDVDEGSNDYETVIFANYHVYFGWGVTGFRKLTKYGQPFTWTRPDDPNNPPRLYKFRVLVADVDRGYKGSSGGLAGTGQAPGGSYSHNSHQPKDGQLMLFKSQDADAVVPISGAVSTTRVTFSWWGGGNRGRGQPPEQQTGLVDNNYGFDDGSVIRYNDVAWFDPRMALTVDTNLDQYNDFGRSTQLPPSN